MKYNKLTPEEERVMMFKGTETPFTGKYLNNKVEGIYTCKRCDAPLYLSKDKFDSHCGWPSFDDEIEGAVTRTPDSDGSRTEISCSNCGAHLGHVFTGEGFTSKNTRHCVNSIAMDFVPQSSIDTAYFASGCFWGTEFFFRKEKGVLFTTAGYMGGTVENPTYEQVCIGSTGHAETIETIFNTEKISYADLVKLFFETHDFTQINRQGPDVGTQYRSVIFVQNKEQEEIAEHYLRMLEEKGYNVATTIIHDTVFWPAEDYHQDYYEHKGGKPYCHTYKKIF